jgi:hypothetical protein
MLLQSNTWVMTIPELIEFAFRTLTLRSGDLICLGTNHEGRSRFRDGETLELLIHGIDRMPLLVEARSSAPGNAASTWARTASITGPSNATVRATLD